MKDTALKIVNLKVKRCPTCADVIHDKKKYCGRKCKPSIIRVIQERAEMKSLRKSKYGESKSYRPPKDYGAWLDYS